MTSVSRTNGGKEVSIELEENDLGPIPQNANDVPDAQDHMDVDNNSNTFDSDSASNFNPNSASNSNSGSGSDPDEIAFASAHISEVDTETDLQHSYSPHSSHAHDQTPGVDVTERDLSPRAQTPAGRSPSSRISTPYYPLVSTTTKTNGKNGNTNGTHSMSINCANAGSKSSKPTVSSSDAAGKAADISITPTTNSLPSCLHSAPRPAVAPPASNYAHLALRALTEYKDSLTTLNDLQKARNRSIEGILRARANLYGALMRGFRMRMRREGRRRGWWSLRCWLVGLGKL
ncbi:hypothetical protein M422DRAFT_45541 [Sphaerobolus stellatus SS14]|uniref:Uncharacterized protein n=1 Tax=Sphaerobolus stellatus (strain SS14) TaxID=990650 RepID=A0A0C9W4I9_SPHS4|nr:hypothetical protein M422DRAFT_45541 [Sphaerobolus stellatus SS14]